MNFDKVSFNLQCRKESFGTNSSLWLAEGKRCSFVGCQALGCRQNQALRAAPPPCRPAPRSLRHRPKASAARPHARAILCGNCAKAVSLVNFRRQVRAHPCTGGPPAGAHLGVGPPSRRPACGCRRGSL